MTTYATGNPVPSVAVKDLSDNAENLDLLMLGAAQYYADRLGVNRLSWRGIEEQFMQYLARSGFVFTNPQTYQAGIVITGYNQIFVRDGNMFSLSTSIGLPYATTGDWATESANFVQRTEQSLLDFLAAATGAQLIGYRSRNVYQRLDDTANVMDYGADPTGAANSLAAFNAAAATGKRPYVPKGSYLITAATASAHWVLDTGVSILGLPNVGTAGGGLPDTSRLTGRIQSSSAGGQIGIRFGDSDPWLTRQVRDPSEYLAEMVVLSSNGGYGALFASRSSDDPTPNMNTIGLGAYGLNNNTTSPEPAWASYREARRIMGAGVTFVDELDMVNEGLNLTGYSPYSDYDTYGPKAPFIGLRLSAGGGDTPTHGNPVTCGMDFNSNGQTFNTGIVYRAGSLTDGKALCMPAAYGTYYYDTAGGISGVINGQGSDLSSWSDNPSFCQQHTYRKFHLDFSSKGGDSIFRLRGAGARGGVEYLAGQMIISQMENFNATSSQARCQLMLLARNNDGIDVGFTMNGQANNSFSPTVDGALRIGDAAARIAGGYTTTAFIVLSDERSKTQIGEIPQEVLDAWESVSYRQFKRLNSLERKGDEARFHLGNIAQDVLAAFEEAGIDPYEYSVLNHNTWDAQDAQFDDDGNVVLEAREAGDQYSINYEEAYILEAECNRRKMAKQDALISQLLERVTALENRE